MTALDSLGLFQFSLLAIIAITFKFSLQSLFMIPGQSKNLYHYFYSNYTQIFCNMSLDE